MNLIKNINEAMKALLINKKNKEKFFKLARINDKSLCNNEQPKKGFTQPYKPKEAFMIIKNTQEINPRGIYGY